MVQVFLNDRLISLVCCARWFFELKFVNIYFIFNNYYYYYIHYLLRISESYINEAKKKIYGRSCDIADEEKSIIEKLLAIDVKVAILMANEMLLAGIDTVSRRIKL